MTDNNSDSIGATPSGNIAGASSRSGPNVTEREGLRAALLELAERCEAATGPDMGLEQAILDAIDDWPAEWIGGRRDFTASLDAAVTLVPEGRDGVLMNCGVEGFHVSNKHRQHIARLFAPFSGERAEGRSITNAALALCAAALRAIAQTKSEGSQ